MRKAKSTQERKHPPIIKFDREIDDEDIWFVLINGDIRRPCRLSSLMFSFERQNKDWNVEVLLRWIKGDGGDVEEFKSIK